MNKIEAKIERIVKNGNLHLVELKAADISLYMLGLELPINFEIGKKASVLFKPSAVVLAKNFSGEISMTNKIECIVKEVNENEILAEVLLSSVCGEFYALITKKSLYAMDIKKNDTILAMFKATEAGLGEV